MPITDVVLRGAPSIRGSLPSPRPAPAGDAVYRPVVQVKTIPPCHEMDVWVERGDLYGAWLRMLRPRVRALAVMDVPNWASAGMYFVVAGRNWDATSDSLEPRPTRVYDGIRSDADLTAARIRGEAAVTLTPIADCGEGG